MINFVPFFKTRRILSFLVGPWRKFTWPRATSVVRSCAACAGAAAGGADFAGSDGAAAGLAGAAAGFAGSAGAAAGFEGAAGAALGFPISTGGAGTFVSCTAGLAGFVSAFGSGFDSGFASGLGSAFTAGLGSGLVGSSLVVAGGADFSSGWVDLVCDAQPDRKNAAKTITEIHVKQLFSACFIPSPFPRPHFFLTIASAIYLFTIV
jgi:hypothetical protein